MSVWSVALFLSQIVIAAVLISRLKKRPENVKERKNRQIIYVIFCAASLMPFGVIGILTRDNWLILLFALDFMILSYTLLVWSKLVTNPNASNKILVRPVAATFLAIIVIFELVIVVISGNAFSTVAMGIPDEAVKNVWLSIGIIMPTAYVTVCVALFFYEILKAAAQINDTLNQDGLYLKYRYECLAVIIGTSLLFIALCLFGLCGYSITKSKEFFDTTVSIRDKVLGLFIVVSFCITVWNANLFNKYKKGHDKKIESYLKQLELLYNQMIELFPASFTSNAFQYAGINSDAWILSSVVKALADIRIRLWRAEAQRLATSKGVSVSTIILPSKATINQDAEVWSNFSKSPEQVAQAKTLLKQIGRVAVSTPAIDGVRNTNNIEQLASYYIKLAKN